MDELVKAKDVKKIGILGIQNGQIIKNIDYELEKIIKNINDINTDDKPRELNVKIKIIPINNKKKLVIECTPTAKLRPLNTVQSTLFNIQETDKETGVILNKLQEIPDYADGQMNIDGEIMKLRPLNTVQSTLFNIQETDKETGVILNKLQEIPDYADGQMNIDGEIMEAPEPIYIGVDM